MGLNKSKGNMYDFIGYTWNAIKGKCYHDCSYCYMKRWGSQKKVRFVESEFKEFDRDIKKYGEGLFIFVGSSCDMWSEDIPEEWIVATTKYCSEYDNRYLFQSKNPERFIEIQDYCREFDIAFEFMERVSLCTTIESNRWYSEIMQSSPALDDRAYWMGSLSQYRRYVTIEPILDFDLDILVSLIRQCNPVQVNIGADSGHNGLPEPSYDKVLDLIAALQEFTVVSQKKNLGRLLKA